MECSSPRDWDGLAESSWTCFPHYFFSRLNGSVFFIPGFCDAVPIGFPLPCFFCFLKSLVCSLQFFILHSDASVPKDTWQTLSLPLPYPLLFLQTQSSLGVQKCSYAASIPGVVPSHRVILPCSEGSCAALVGCSFRGELCPLCSAGHQHCKSSKSLVPLKIPSACQVWLKLASWFKSY